MLIHTLFLNPNRFQYLFKKFDIIFFFRIHKGNLVKRIIYRYGIYCKSNLFLSVVGSQGIVTCCKNTFFVVNIFNGWLFCESEVRKNILYTYITSFNTFLEYFLPHPDITSMYGHQKEYR